MKVEIDVGKTQYNQTVLVVGERDKPGDPWRFSLVKQAIGQRDDQLTIYNLPGDVLEAIGKAAAMVKSTKE